MTGPEAHCDGNHPLVWVVDSEYTGELHARIGVAERLGYGFELIPLPAGDLREYRERLKAKYRATANGSQAPVLIISGTGEETTAEFADLKQDFREQLFNVYLASILPDDRHPRLDEYDLIASPQIEGANVVTLVGVPHQMTIEKLEEGRRRHADFFNGLNKPVIGLLIGGNTRYCNGFDDEHAERLAQRIRKIADALNADIVMTNSRRTPLGAQSVLLKALADRRCYFFDWQGGDNTFYLALLAHADLFIVTGDSLSMCSEAAFTGKPLLVDLCRRATESYHREIVGRLVDYGAAKVLGNLYEPWTYVPPDPTEQVVKKIRERVETLIS